MLLDCKCIEDWISLWAVANHSSCFRGLSSHIIGTNGDKTTRLGDLIHQYFKCRRFTSPIHSQKCKTFSTIKAKREVSNGCYVTSLTCLFVFLLQAMHSDGQILWTYITHASCLYYHIFVLLHLLGNRVQTSYCGDFNFALQAAFCKQLSVLNQRQYQNQSTIWQTKAKQSPLMLLICHASLDSKDAFPSASAILFS